MNKTIKMNEQELNRLISESVKRVLNEESVMPNGTKVRFEINSWLNVINQTIYGLEIAIDNQNISEQLLKQVIGKIKHAITNINDVTDILRNKSIN